MQKIVNQLEVLNLIITGIPSIHDYERHNECRNSVLNLIITGIPSILMKNVIPELLKEFSFKPYYNWNTFNTLDNHTFDDCLVQVLNLIITGIPSILCDGH